MQGSALQEMENVLVACLGVVLHVHGKTVFILLDPATAVTTQQVEQPTSSAHAYLQLSCCS